MTTPTMPRLQHPAVFVAAATGVFAASIAIAGALPDLPNAGAMAIGVACDLALLVPALYYLLLVRGRGWRPITVVPVFLLGMLAAGWVLPEGHREPVAVLEWLLVPLELGILGWIGWRAAVSVRRLRNRVREDRADAYDAIRAAACKITGSPRVGGILAQELAAIYYALFSWRAPRPPDRSSGFTSYRECSYGVFLTAISLMVLVETVGVHALIHVLWSPAVAWVFTAIGAYGLLWVVGDFQALRLRRTEVTPDGVLVRLGTRWEVELPRDAIVSAGRLGSARPPGDDDSSTPLEIVVLGTANVEIRLSRAVTARTLFGIRRRATTIHLQIDDPDRFLERICSECHAKT